VPKQNLSLAQQCSFSGGVPESFQKSDIINSTCSSQDYGSESSSKTLRCIIAKCLKLESREEGWKNYSGNFCMPVLPAMFSFYVASKQGKATEPRIVDESFGSLSLGSRGRLEGRQQG